jgi:hypothetical protein
MQPLLMLHGSKMENRKTATQLSDLFDFMTGRDDQHAQEVKCD